jgi:hypothetical protein
VAASFGPSVSEKLSRAHLHREDLENRIERFVQGNAYHSFREDDSEAGQRLWRVKILKHPPSVQWGVFIGDCLFNFRSALDHLAYDLAVAHRGSPLPASVEKGSAFPIFVKQAPGTAELDRMIGAVHPDARHLIEQMQPYGRKDRAALKYLHDLQNFRGRQLQPFRRQ